MIRCSIVFAAEVECWPDAAVCDGDPGPYLNSGAVLGPKALFLAMLDHIKRDQADFAYCGGDDQRAYAHFSREAPDAVALDVENRLFLATHGASWAVDMDGTTPVFRARGRDGERGAPLTPAVVHLNSYDGKAMFDALAPAIVGAVDPGELSRAPGSQ